MTPKAWKTLSSRIVYENPWIRLREDIAEMPDGNQTLYGLVEMPDAVGVLPFIDDQRVILVRQYRYVFAENHRWEIPSGAVNPGESLEQAARRELREEIGYDASDLQYINTFFSSKSVMQEKAHLYIGRDLKQARAVPDETEFLEVATMPFERAFQMVITNEIRDSMSVIAILLAAHLRQG